MKPVPFFKALARCARSLPGALAFRACPFAAAKKIASSFEPHPEGPGCELFACSAALVSLDKGHRPSRSERKALRLALDALRGFAPAAGELADACCAPSRRFCEIYRPDGSKFFICPCPEPLQSSVQGLKLGWPEWAQRTRLLERRSQLARIHSAMEQLPDSALPCACACLAASLNGLRAPASSFARSSLMDWGLQMRLLLERRALGAATQPEAAPGAGGPAEPKAKAGRL